MSEARRQITRAAGVFGFFTLLSRILGLIRDLVTAYLFGAGPAADAFFVAFRIPNLLRRLSAEGAMASAFVPIYSQALIHDGPEEARRTAGAAFSALALILAVISVLGVVFAPQIVTVFAPGFLDQPDKFELTVLLTRIVFPYIFFISLATLFMSQLNALGHFAAPAAAPIILNVSIIAFALLLSPRLGQPAVALALGAVIGGVGQLVLQIRPLIKRHALPGFIWEPGLARVKEMGRRLVPVIFGAAVYQVNLLVGTLLASLLPSGSVSYLYYADRLVQFPLGVFGVALGTAILPSLSRHAAKGETEDLAVSTGHGLRLSLFILLPSAVGLALLADPLVGLIYQHGRFTAETAQMTRFALLAFAPGLPLVGLATVLIRLFNALNDTRTPAILGAYSVAANIVLSLLLMGPLAHAGLALASSIAGGVNLLLLLLKLRTKAPYLKEAGLFRGVGRSFAAAAGLAVLLLLGFFWPSSPLIGQADWLKVAVGVIGGAAAYFVLAWLFRCPELWALKEDLLGGKRT